MLLFYARLGNVGSSPRSSDLVKLAQECCYHSNGGIAAHGVRVLTNIAVSCQEKGKCAQSGQGSVDVVASVIFSLCALMHTGIAHVRVTYTATGRVLGLSRGQVLSISGC